MKGLLNPLQVRKIKEEKRVWGADFCFQAGNGESDDKKKNKKVHAAFTDLEKTKDEVNRNGVWEVLTFVVYKEDF